MQTPFGEVAGLGADMVTVNPLMGADAIEPFVDAPRVPPARACWRSCAPPTRAPPTSRISSSPAEAPCGSACAGLVDELGRAGVGEAGLSDVGAVVGATVPAHLARARELMPHAVFLLPGVGAQGGRVEDLAPAFVPGRAGGLDHRLALASPARTSRTGGDPAATARAEAERLRAAAWERR